MNRFICFRITLIIVFIAVFFNRVSAVEFDSGMMFGITVQKQLQNDLVRKCNKTCG